jgi:hypothetical protein
LGENFTVFLQKGKKKNFNFGGKLHDFIEFFFGESALERPLL